MSELEKGKSRLGDMSFESDYLSSDTPPQKRTAKQNVKKFFSDFKSHDLNDVGFDTTGMTEKEIRFEMIKNESSSKAKLTTRHAIVSSLAGAVGTGLFIGMGNSLKGGGPAAVLIGFALTGITVLCFMGSLGELGVRYRSASFTTYVSRFLDESWGFACAWMYALCWLIVMPIELITSAIVIRYWHDDNNAAAKVNPVAWVSIFYVCIIVITFFGVKGYGEAEFIFSAIKVLAAIGFIIFGIVIDVGGGPNHQYIGAKLFDNPGSFASGFKGVAVAIVNSAFAYGGTEISGLAAASSKAPHRAFPAVVKSVVWRICLFFITLTLMVCLLVPYTEEGLGVTSPFVIAINNAGVRGLPSVFNAVIIISVFSVANSATFAASRVISTLAVDGHAPAIFATTDRRGRPTAALILTIIFGGLSFLAAYEDYGQVFDWMYAFVSLSFLYLWASISWCVIRHRQALKREGISLKSLLYRSPFGIPGAIFGFGSTVTIIAFQLWLAIVPLHQSPDPQAFFKQMLSLPVAIILFVGHKLWTRKGPVWSKDLDVTSELRIYDMDIIAAEDAVHSEKMRTNIMYRIYHIFC